MLALAGACLPLGCQQNTGPGAHILYLYLHLLASVKNIAQPICNAYR